jgi:hypothetical protein
VKVARRNSRWSYFEILPHVVDRGGHPFVEENEFWRWQATEAPER